MAGDSAEILELRRTSHLDLKADLLQQFHIYILLFKANNFKDFIYK